MHSTFAACVVSLSLSLALWTLSSLCCSLVSLFALCFFFHVVHCDGGVSSSQGHAHDNYSYHYHAQVTTETVSGTGPPGWNLVVRPVLWIKQEVGLHFT